MIIIGEKTAKNIGERSGIIQNRLILLNDVKYGLDNEEDVGLTKDDRKRRRSGPETKVVMDTDDKLKNVYNERIDPNTDADLSNLDCSTSSKNVMAQLALQASHEP